MANLVENKTDNDIYMDFIQILNKISQPNKKSKKFAHFNVTKIITKKIKAETETEEFHDRVYYFSCFSLQKNWTKEVRSFQIRSFCTDKGFMGAIQMYIFCNCFSFCVYRFLLNSP